MAINKRGDSPVNTSPHLTQQLKNNPLKMLLKLAMVPLIPLGLLWYFGGPALLTTYQYSGSHSSPVMSECNYITLNGWRVVHPSYGYNQCSIITLLPFDVKAFLEVLI